MKRELGKMYLLPDTYTAIFFIVQMLNMRKKIIELKRKKTDKEEVKRQLVKHQYSIWINRRDGRIEYSVRNNQQTSSKISSISKISFSYLFPTFK